MDILIDILIIVAMIAVYLKYQDKFHEWSFSIENSIPLFIIALLAMGVLRGCRMAF